MRFDMYTPLASNRILAERLLTPLTFAKLARLSKTSGANMDGQPIDLQHEQFRVVVPRNVPAAGYGVLIFIPPWDDDHLPPGWRSVLETNGIIFVSASKSGNAASPLERRAPLAILAAYNVMRRYNTDPERVFIGGFSGGARIALHLALGYPDIFRGAFLDAGSDPIGEGDLPLPPPSRDLFDRFMNTSKLFYFTGREDQANLDTADLSVASMKNFCVMNIMQQSQAGLSHEIATAYGLATGLKQFAQTPREKTAKDELCRARVTREIDAALQHVEAALAVPDPKTAKTLLDRLDRRYGGLARPRSLMLADKLISTSP